MKGLVCDILGLMVLISLTIKISFQHIVVFLLTSYFTWLHWRYGQSRYNCQVEGERQGVVQKLSTYKHKIYTAYNNNNNNDDNKKRSCYTIYK